MVFNHSNSHGRGVSGIVSGPVAIRAEEGTVAVHVRLFTRREGMDY
jgi:hypothetical protein